MKRCALLCLLALWAVSAEAATYYVRTGGHDSHSCGQAQTDNNSNAKASIQAGINCVRGPGDTVIVHGGNYGGPGKAIRTPEVSGRDLGAGAITVRAATNETVWHTGFFWMWESNASFWIIDGINIDQANSGAVEDSAVLINDNCRLMNLEVKNSRHIGIMFGNGPAEIINVKSHGHGMAPDSWCQGQGSQCHGLYLHPHATQIVEGGEFWNNGGQGIAIVYGPGNVTVRNARIHDNPGAGIQLVGQPGLKPSVKAYNNLIYNNAGSGFWVQDAGPTEISNNTFYGNAGDGIGGWNNNTTIRNNIISNNGVTISLTGSGNTFSNNLTTNPKFINAGAGDFRLQPGSPAIKAGVTVSGVTTDFDKRPRPQGVGFTIGAYEYIDSAARPPSAPKRPRRSK